MLRCPAGVALLPRRHNCPRLCCATFRVPHAPCAGLRCKCTDENNHVVSHNKIEAGPVGRIPQNGRQDIDRHPKVASFLIPCGPPMLCMMRNSKVGPGRTARKWCGSQTCSRGVPVQSISKGLCLSLATSTMPRTAKHIKKGRSGGAKNPAAPPSVLRHRSVVCLMAGHAD